MKIWTDRKGRVHAKGHGDLLKQLMELDSITTYSKKLSSSMLAKAARISGAEPEILMANEELRKQIATQARTIAIYDADMKKRYLNRGPKGEKVTELPKKQEKAV